MEFWNRLDLEPPPFSSSPIISDNPGCVSASLKSVMDKIVTTLNNQRALHLEGAVLANLIRRFKTMLGKDKGFKDLEKVNKCLRRYMVLDLLATVEEVRSMSHTNFGPTQNMLEWCLLRIMGFARLFDRVAKITFQAGLHFNRCLRSGHVWKIVLMFTAIMSRIWTISCYLVSSSCDWYTDLLEYLSFVKSDDGYEWQLPQDFKLPSTLQDWLGNPEYLQPPKIKASLRRDNNDVQEDGTVKRPELQNDYHNGGRLIFNEDLGEVLSRDTLTPRSSKKQHTDLEVISKDALTEQKSKTVDIDVERVITKLNSAKALELFLKSEQLSRKKDIQSALTKHIESMQWKILRLYIFDKLSTIKTIKDPLEAALQFSKIQKKLRSMI